MVFLEQIADDRGLLAGGCTALTISPLLAGRLLPSALVYRIEFGAIARQRYQAQPRRAGSHKPLDDARLVNRMAVHDQTDLALDLLEQSAEKTHEQRRPEFS